MINVTIPDHYNGACNVCREDMWGVSSHEIRVIYKEPLVMEYGPDMVSHRVYICDTCVVAIRDGTSKLYRYENTESIEVTNSYTGKES
jgi:hypothetical protein|tara:strand:- start:853 stop:1116 length:264 start_codon:yes stop_codon:yes gene_type:complete